MVYLERYKIGEIRKVIKLLNKSILPDILDKLEKRLRKIEERGSDLGADTTKRLQDMQKELTKLSDDLAAQVQTSISTDMSDLSRHEVDWQANVIKHSVGFDIDMVIPSPRAVLAATKATSFAGLKIDDWFETLSRSTQRNVMSAVNRGIVEGETVDQITRRIRGSKALNYTDGVFETTRRQAETLTRTTISHVSNQAALEFYKANDDIISGLKWISTLDSRTSVICAGLDGKIFAPDKGPRPPAHPNCRSRMTAILKDADALGLKDIPEGKRASMDGQVPGSTTYEQWLRRQSVSVQEEVLGVTKSKLFRDGNLSIERFTDSNLKPLSIEQLRVTEKKAFERTGL